MLSVCVYVVCFEAMVLFVVGILFGYQVNDRYWLPRPDQNFLSWGFGFMVISMIVSLAAGVLLFKAAWATYQVNNPIQSTVPYTAEHTVWREISIKGHLTPEFT